jgi:hypothetical protein
MRKLKIIEHISLDLTDRPAPQPLAWLLVAVRPTRAPG